jgi:hypothetical protein
MKRIALTLALLPAPALAHDGLHHHPHGIEGGWVLLAACLGAGTCRALARARRRK